MKIKELKEKFTYLTGFSATADNAKKFLAGDYRKRETWEEVIALLEKDPALVNKKEVPSNQLQHGLSVRQLIDGWHIFHKPLPGSLSYLSFDDIDLDAPEAFLEFIKDEDTEKDVEVVRKLLPAWQAFVKQIKDILEANGQPSVKIGHATTIEEWDGLKGLSLFQAVQILFEKRLIIDDLVEIKKATALEIVTFFLEVQRYTSHKISSPITLFDLSIQLNRLDIIRSAFIPLQGFKFNASPENFYNSKSMQLFPPKVKNRENNGLLFLLPLFQE